jgi:Glycosyl hydrolase catalytic core
VGRAVALVLVLAGLAAGAATAAPSLKLGITDSGDAYFTPATTFYPDLGRLHAQVLRVHLNWGGRLGVAVKRPVDGADADDPAYDWARYDAIVLGAADEDVEIMFTIFGSPRWANGGQLPTRAPRRAADLLDFSFAAAQRYGGDYMRADGIVLPRVRFWTAWNEPNLTIGLVPQWKRIGTRWVIQSAIDYARICNAVVDGIRGTLIPGEQIACGDTGPRGNNAPLGERPTTSPLAFLRAMKKAGAEGFDAYAHHPYPSGPSETPTTRPRAATAVSFGNLDTLEAEVTRLYGRKPIWIDEYGYQTNPPDDDLGVSPAKQARYLTQSVALARRDPRVTMLLWFLVRDEQRLIGWQSGLETWDGIRKPAYAAFVRAADAG